MLSGGSLTDFNTEDTDLTSKVRMFFAAISSTLLVPILELSSARSIFAARAAGKLMIKILILLESDL